MALITVSTGLIAIALSTLSANAQATFPLTPLASKTGFTYPSGIPYQVDTEPQLIRGGQFGYNLCNSTTEGQESLCQTALFNSIDDFCIWAPPEYNSTVGNTEGEMVAFCTKPGRGTRLIPEGTLQGIQWTRTPDYVQAVGFIDHTKLNIAAEDWGGEMDPHGADTRGNPLGGLVFSNAWSDSNSSYTQVIEWHLFLGRGSFCFKVCDPRGALDARYCEHVFDRIGCAYNAPSNATTGVFEVCDGDNQSFPGIYTVNGVEMTYTQPPEELGSISTMPYEPVVPASSNCRPFASSDLYKQLATVTAAGSQSTTGTSAPSATGAPGASHTSGTKSATTGTRTGTAAGAQQTGDGNGASALALSTLSLFAVALSVASLF